jgi:uncharacterized protein DUF4112
MGRTYDYDLATGTLRDGAVRERAFRDDAAGPHSRRETLARLDRLATLLDSVFVIPGTGIRFGADALVGLVPGLGDLITTGLSAYIVYEAHRLGAPTHLITRMIANVAFDAVITAVPVAGNVADVFFRANRRNVRLLREWLDREGFR